MWRQMVFLVGKDGETGGRGDNSYAATYGAKETLVYVASEE
jgi:hypothetical protein